MTNQNRTASNLVVVDRHHLSAINEQIIRLSLILQYIGMALIAEDEHALKAVIQLVIVMLFIEVETLTQVSNDIESLILQPTIQTPPDSNKGGFDDE